MESAFSRTGAFLAIALAASIGLSGCAQAVCSLAPPLMGHWRVEGADDHDYYAGPGDGTLDGAYVRKDAAETKQGSYRITDIETVDTEDGRDCGVKSVTADITLDGTTGEAAWSFEGRTEARVQNLGAWTDRPEWINVTYVDSTTSP